MKGKEGLKSQEIWLGENEKKQPKTGGFVNILNRGRVGKKGLEDPEAKYPGGLELSARPL